MKKRSNIIISFAAIVLVIGTVVAVFWFFTPRELRNMLSFMSGKEGPYENHQEYQVIDRNESALVPTSFVPVVAETMEDDYNCNITVVTGMVQNERSKMFKKAGVQPNGATDYAGWHLIADEGFKDGVNTFGPSPLSYLTSGTAANLHTQILRAAEVMNVELEGVKVEVLNKFHWEDMLAAGGAGFLSETHTNIIIKSSESAGTIKKLKEIALNAWTAGEALGNATTIEPTLVVNGDHWENKHAVPGTTISDESYVEGLRISYITDGARKSEYLEQVKEEDRDMSFDAMTNLVFEILAISESAENPNRPYLKKITVSFNTSDSETWEIYSDELNGTGQNPAAPTSLEYLTAGTALCLTSQLTLVSAMMDLDNTGYRVESQIDYREENVKSTEMAGYADIVHSRILVESEESEERLNSFFNKSLALCFAGEGLKGVTDMYTHCYLNGMELK